MTSSIALTASMYVTNVRKNDIVIVPQHRFRADVGNGSNVTKVRQSSMALTHMLLTCCKAAENWRPVC